MSSSSGPLGYLAGRLVAIAAAAALALLVRCALVSALCKIYPRAIRSKKSACDPVEKNGAGVYQRIINMMPPLDIIARIGDPSSNGDLREFDSAD